MEGPEKKARPERPSGGMDVWAGPILRRGVLIVVHGDRDDPKVVQSSTFVANTIAIASNAIFSPQSTLIIVPPGKEKSPHPEKLPGAKIASPHFNIVFFSVLALTLILIAVWIWIGTWSSPTENEQKVFDHIGYLATACLGAILGLLGGKELT
jgi:hypothetical protein